MPTHPTISRTLALLTLPCLALACTLTTKLGELDDDGGDETGAPATSGDQPTGEAPPIDDGDGDGTATTAGATCTAVHRKLAPVRTHMVLVLDKSGSMVAPPDGLWDHDGDPNTPDVTRWSSLHQVVEGVLGEFDGRIDFGAHLYPGLDATFNYDASACVVDDEIGVAVAADNGAAILAAIPGAAADDLRGGTPVSAALTVALDHLKSLDPEVPRAVLLVTDGAANCAAAAESDDDRFEAYDEQVHAIVGDAYTLDDIPTYVVGVDIEDVTSAVAQDGAPDDTNTFDRLNQLAEDGGRPRADPGERFFNAADQGELAAALDEIAVDALTCILPLVDPPVDPGATEVLVDGAAVPQVGDCQTESGWVYTNPAGPFDAVRLCGAACGALKLTGTAELTVCTDA